MIIEQIYTKCLSQATYYIESNGVAAVIDPLRDVNEYLELAARHNARIVYVFETHFHADFVSGHLDLVSRANATIVYGPEAQPAFPALVARDGATFTVGELTIAVLHTPGHTLESTCYLLQDNSGKPIALFTGDTLLIGDVGRPDVAQAATGLTKEALAGMLYESLQKKILPLPDDITVYPGHGAGSACGKNMCAETTDSLGHQKRTNYALRAGITREEFIKEVTDGLTPPPAYFSADASLNKNGYKSFEDILQRGLRRLSAQECQQALLDKSAIVLDTRCPEEFCKAFIPGSINIGLEGQFAPWAGTVLPDLKQPLIIVADPGREKETVTRLARIGHDNVVGCLEKGFDTWYHSNHPIHWIITIPVSKLAEDMAKKKRNIIDVREEADFRKSHLPGAMNIPLSRFAEAEQKLDPKETYYVYCTSGYRSVIFISLLRSKGLRYLINVVGGMNAILQAGAFELKMEEVS